MHSFHSYVPCVLHNIAALVPVTSLGRKDDFVHVKISSTQFWWQTNACRKQSKFHPREKFMPTCDDSKTIRSQLPTSNTKTHQPHNQHVPAAINNSYLTSCRWHIFSKQCASLQLSGSSRGHDGARRDDELKWCSPRPTTDQWTWRLWQNVRELLFPLH